MPVFTLVVLDLPQLVPHLVHALDQLLVAELGQVFERSHNFENEAEIVLI